MSEIKVVPYIPDEDYDNPAMVVDFYEFTMANCLFLNGFKDTTLVFDMFFRKVPDGGGYAIMAGLEQFINAVDSLKFTEEDINYLRSTGAFNEQFLDYLRNFKLHCNIWAIAVSYTHLRAHET